MKPAYLKDVVKPATRTWDIYTATLQGGNPASPGFEARNLKDLKTQIAEYFINRDRQADVNLQVVEIIAPNDEAFKLYPVGVAKLKAEIDAMIQEAYAEHKSWAAHINKQ